MATEVSTRRATDGDAEAIADLRVAARSEVAPERGGELLLDSWPYTDQPSDITHVGLIGSVVVGYVVAGVEQGNDHRLCFVRELYVASPARTVGVGSAMLAVTIDAAQLAGCTAIESQVLPGNRAAKNFFERLGLVTRHMRVSRRL